MVDSQIAAAGYTIPRYRAPDDATWHHVLHGNVPAHQIDFMYCPEVPQGLLTPTHFSHLARLMKYIEPRTNASHAFAIGNLSRDDTQHEAGHGAVGLIFGMRIGGATDHAGRSNPPFAHGVLAVDRDLTYAALLEASATFYRHVMNAGEARSSTADFYREYIRSIVETPEHVRHVLARYVEDFDDLPHLRRSALPWDWIADEDAQPKRVVIVHRNDEVFGTIAHAAAKLGSLLYRSNVRWTSITTGREADIAGGVSVHFAPERDITAEDKRGGALVRMEDLPEDEADLARDLFGAKPRVDASEKRPRAGWRERYASQMAHEGDAPAAAGFPREAAAREGGAREAPARAEHGTEIIAPHSMREKLARGHRSSPDAAEVHGGEGTAGAGAGAARSAGAASARGAEMAGAGTNRAALAGAAGAQGWRDAGAPTSRVPSDSGAGARNGGGGRYGGLGPVDAPGADEIEVTVEKPSSSSKRWLWALIGVAFVGALAAFLVIPIGTPPEPAPSAQSSAPGTISAAPPSTAAPSTPSASSTAAPTTSPTAPRTAPMSSSGAATSTGLTKKRKPPPKKCKVFGDTLCP